MTNPVICYLGIGSNLQDPPAQLSQALTRLASLPQTRLLRRSPWYRSKAVGPGPQADYLNGVIEIETTLAPYALLAALQSIENTQGRTREVRWGARTLDLDILLYGNEQIRHADLEIPHPRIAERNFVLLPLADLNPQLKLPVTAEAKSETIAELLARLPQDDLLPNNICRADGEHLAVCFLNDVRTQ